MPPRLPHLWVSVCNWIFIGPQFKLKLKYGGIRIIVLLFKSLCREKLPSSIEFLFTLMTGFTKNLMVCKEIDCNYINFYPVTLKGKSELDSVLEIKMAQ